MNLFYEHRRHLKENSLLAASKTRIVKPRKLKSLYAPPTPKLQIPNKPAAQTKVPNMQKPLAANTTQQRGLATLDKSLPTPQKASNDSKDGFLKQGSLPILKFDDNDDRYS